MAEIIKQKIRGKEVIFIEGDVTGFYINEIPKDKIKTYAGKNGPWTPTHRYSLVMGEHRISLGMGDKDGVSDRQQIRVKDNDDQYHNLVRGLKVSVEVEENGEYQGKTQYQSSSSKVVVLDASGAVQQAPAAGGGQSQGQGPQKPKDMTGISTGHAFNGAMNFILAFGVEPTNDNIIRYATSIHNVTEKLKEAGKLKFPDMSAYDLGAMIGNAVLNASKLAGLEGDFEENVYSIAMDFLDNVVPAISKYVKEGKGAAPAPKVSRAAPAKKAAAKAKPAPQEEGNDAPFDMDDDIPF